MKYVNFTDEEKIEFFNMIAERYYNRNFGTMLKADIDILIFSVYLEHCISNNIPCDDYTMSMNLGLTESRIRSLKERKQLQYPRRGYEWKKEFVNLISNAKYNDVKKMIQLNIEDVNLLKDVRHFVRSKGWYDEFQLNPRLFQCRLDYFILLCGELENDVQISEETANALKELAKNENELSAIEKIISGSFEDGVKDLLIDLSTDGITELLRLLPFGGIAGKAIKELIKVLKK